MDDDGLGLAGCVLILAGVVGAFVLAGAIIGLVVGSASLVAGWIGG